MTDFAPLKQLINDEAFSQLAESLLKEGKHITFRAQGGSMKPLIRNHDRVEVRPVSGGDLSAGDIVLARVGGTAMVLHRIIAIDESSGTSVYVLRGDAINQHEERVTASQVFGKAVALERNGRRHALDRGFHRWVALLTRRIPILHRVKRRIERSRETKDRSTRGSSLQHPPPA